MVNRFALPADDGPSQNAQYFKDDGMEPYVACDDCTVEDKAENWHGALAPASEGSHMQVDTRCLSYGRRFTRESVQRLMNCEGFKRHVRDCKLDVCAVAEAQHRVNVLNDLRDADPAGFAQICQGIFVKEHDDRVCHRRVAIFIHCLWVIVCKICGPSSVIESCRGLCSYWHGACIVYQFLISGLLGLFLNALGWYLFGSYLMANSHHDKLPTAPPSGRVFLSYVLDALLMRVTYSASLVTSVLSMLVSEKRNSAGQWLVGIQRRQELCTYMTAQ